MDNEAFRALVNERSRTKTTKEIAREAVERDFEEKGKRRKRGRRRGGGGSSSSEEDDDDNDGLSRRWRGENDNQEEGEEDEPEWKKIRRLKKKKKNGDEDDEETKYRDRAKERREGKNRDYDNDAELAKLRAAAETLEDEGMSKFLGGDERHTHLVKGLDKTLAEKVRREEMGKGKGGRLGSRDEEERDIDLDEVMEEATGDRRRRRDGHELDLDRVPVPTSSLGQGMVAYLQSLQNATTASKNNASPISPQNKFASSSYHHHHHHKETFPTAAGLAVQRSTFSFSTVANVGDVLRSWEIPRESTKSQLAYSSDSTRFISTPFDHNFIERIRSALAIQHELEQKEKEQRKKKKKKKKKRKEHDDYEDEKMDYDLQDENALQIGNPNGSKLNKDIIDSAGKDGKRSSSSKAIVSNTAKADDDDESDDDIFADAGEYVPPSASTSYGNNSKSKKEKTNDKKKKKSVFSGLIAGTEENVDTTNHGTEKTVKTEDTPKIELSLLGDDDGKRRPKMVHFKDKNDIQEEGKIDRDILGARSGKHSKHMLSKEGGVSISSYEGGYGEEMDVDFGGFAEDEEDGKRGKGKNSEETTMAAKEYGGRGKSARSNLDDDGNGML